MVGVEPAVDQTHERLGRQRSARPRRCRRATARARHPPVRDRGGRRARDPSSAPPPTPALRRLAGPAGDHAEVVRDSAATRPPGSWRPGRGRPSMSQVWSACSLSRIRRNAARSRSDPEQVQPPVRHARPRPSRPPARGSRVDRDAVADLAERRPWRSRRPRSADRLDAGRGLALRARVEEQRKISAPDPRCEATWATDQSSS